MRVELRSDWERAEARSEARRMYREGDGVSAIAAHIACTERTVHRYVLDLPKRIRNKPTEANRRRVVELGQRGLSMNEIHRRHGHSLPLIRRWLMAAGVPLRRPGRTAIGMSNGEYKRRRVA